MAKITDLEPLGIRLHSVHEDFIGILDLLTGPLRSELRGIYDEIALERHGARKWKGRVIPNSAITIQGSMDVFVKALSSDDKSSTRALQALWHNSALTEPSI